MSNFNIRSKAVVSLFIFDPFVSDGSVLGRCFAYVVPSVVSSLAITFMGRRDGYFTLIGILIACTC